MIHSVDDDLAPQDVRPEFLESVDHRQKLFLRSCVMNLSLDEGLTDGYYVAYKPITLSSIFFMFIEMKYIHCHSSVMFVMKYMSMCND